MHHRLLACYLALSLALACRSGTPAPVEGPIAAGGAEVVAGAARSATALAALFAAAEQVADDALLETFRRFDIAPRPDPAIAALFPVRRELAQAVEAWPADRKRAAMEWLQANVTWSSQLRALVIESFGPDFEPLAWGPSMSAFDPTVFANRTSLAPLLRAAWDDPAIRRIAATVAVQQAPFDAASARARREKLLAYLRLDEPLPTFYAFFDPLLAPWTGVNAFLPDGSIVLVVGPSPDESSRSMVLFHEMAHPPVDRVMSQPDVQAALAASRCAFEPIEQRFGYETWQGFFAEALVRSLSYRLEGVAAMDTGFVFEQALFDALARWEQTPGVPFEAAVIEMLQAVRERHCR